MYLYMVYIVFFILNKGPSETITTTGRILFYILAFLDKVKTAVVFYILFYWLKIFWYLIKLLVKRLDPG